MTRDASCMQVRHIRIILEAGIRNGRTAVSTFQDGGQMKGLQESNYERRDIKLMADPSTGGLVRN